MAVMAATVARLLSAPCKGELGKGRAENERPCSSNQSHSQRVAAKTPHCSGWVECAGCHLRVLRVVRRHYERIVNYSPRHQTWKDYSTPVHFFTFSARFFWSDR